MLCKLSDHAKRRINENKYLTRDERDCIIRTHDNYWNLKDKIEESIAEIKASFYGPEEASETDAERAEVFNNALDYCLDILEKKLGEFNDTTGSNQSLL